MTPEDGQLEVAILHLLRGRRAGVTACPSEVARSISQDGWRELMPAIRATARTLAEAGTIEVVQRGQVLDAHGTWRGPIRLRLRQ